MSSPFVARGSMHNAYAIDQCLYESLYEIYHCAVCDRVNSSLFLYTFSYLFMYHLDQSFLPVNDYVNCL